MDLDRLQKALQDLIRKLGKRVDYLALYPCRVLKDHGDHHLDLQPETDVLPTMVRVPLRLFLPGVQVKVRPGARVLLAFENGDPSLPTCQMWQAGQLESLTVTTTAALAVHAQGVATVSSAVQANVTAPIVHLAGGGAAVARHGDPVVNGVVQATTTKVFSG